MMRRIMILSLFLFGVSTVANAQSYHITITPNQKEQAPKVEVDEDIDDGWNYRLPNLNPIYQVYSFPSYGLYQQPQIMAFPVQVARPRVWTNPKLKVKVKQSF